MNSSDLDALAQRANAAGFVSIAAYAVALEDALKRIYDHGKTHDEPCWALHNGDCADVFQEIARATLALPSSPEDH